MTSSLVFGLVAGIALGIVGTAVVLTGVAWYLLSGFKRFD